MALEFGGEREIAHPVAFGWKRDEDDQYLAHMSIESSGKMPAKRKTRAPDTNRDLLGYSFPATADEGERRAKLAYRGDKKPVLILEFEQHGSAFYYPVRSNLTIIVRRFKKGGKVSFAAMLVRYKHQQEQIIFATQPEKSALKAARALCEMPRWFYHGGSWRSITWMNHHVMYIGLDKTPLKIQKNQVYSIESWWVDGHFFWETATKPRPSKIIVWEKRHDRRDSMNFVDKRNEMSFSAERVPEFVGDLSYLPRTRKTGAVPFPENVYLSKDDVGIAGSINRDALSFENLVGEGHQNPTI